MGGHPTSDGKKMKTGILYRSENLSVLSKNDLEKIHQFKIRLICDVRSPSERRSRMDRIPEHHNTRIVNIPIFQAGQEFSGREYFRFLFQKSDDFDYHKFIKKLYRSFVFDNTTQIKEIFTLVSDRNNLPALVHCAAGKDRTGLVSAFLQLTAGVPMDFVLSDYEATNRCIASKVEKSVRMMGWLRLFKASPERLRLTMGVRRDYLKDTLDEIILRYGSVENYLLQACLIEPSCLQEIRSLLVDGNQSELPLKRKIQGSDIIADIR